MEHKWIKRISFFLALVMLLTLLPVTALAEEAEPAQTYTVAVMAADNNIGRTGGGGVFSPGDNVTVIAYPQNGYRFVGWYDSEDTKYNNRLSDKASYTFPVTGDTSLVAKYAVQPGATATLTVTGSSFTLNGEAQSGTAEAAFNVGEAIFLSFTDTDKQFLYWVNGNGKIVSTESSYSFILGDNITVNAIYRDADGNAPARVIFRNYYNQIIFDTASVLNYTGDYDFTADLGSIRSIKMGYTFDGWYLADADGKLSTTAATNAAIHAVEGKLVVVLPKYKTSRETYRVNVSYKTEAGDAIDDRPAVLTPDIPVGDKRNFTAPEIEGYQFLYWKMGSDVVGYDSIYSVIRAHGGTVELTAVYGDTEAVVVQAALVNIIQTYGATSGTKYVVTNTMQYYLPWEEAQVIEAGFIYGTSKTVFTDTTANENLVLGHEKTYRSVSTLTENRGIYTFSGSLTKTDTILNIKGYVTYRYNGEVETVYSSLVRGTYYELTNTAPVTVENKVATTSSDATLVGQPQNNDVPVTATVPQGVVITTEATPETGPVTLTVTAKKSDETTPEVVTAQVDQNTQQATNYDVKIEGVAETNTKPIVVHLQGVLPVGLLSTDVSAYHSGASMDYRNTANLTEKDTYYYDPATGDVYICVTRFSDFTFVHKRFTHTVTLDVNGDGAVTTFPAVAVTTGAAMPALDASALPTREGYTFLGYFDAPTDGTMYYTATGISAHEWDKTGSSNILYAHWAQKIAINPTVTLDGWTYGGDANTPTVDGNTGNGAVTYTYSVKGSDDFTATKPTNAGAYTVKAVIAETANYSGFTVTSDFTIQKAAVTAPAIASKTYTGATQTADVATSNLYSVTTNAGGTNVGTYNVVLTLTDSANYKWTDSEEAAKTLTFNITKASINPTVTLSGWTFGGDANIPVVTNNTGSGAVTYTYAVKGSDDFAVAVPTNAGTYTVKAEIAETANYSGFTVTTDFTIQKATVTAPAIASKTYTGATQTADVEASGRYTVTTNNGGTNVGSYDVVLTLNDTGNYKWPDSDNASKTLTFHITKATAPAMTLPTPAAVTYDPATTLASVTLSGGWSWVDDSVVPTVGNSGYSAVLTVDDANYNYTGVDGYNATAHTVTRTVPLTVNRASITPTVTLDGWTYGGAANIPTVDGNTGSGAVTYYYKSQGAADSTYTATVPTNAGTYTVKAVIAETANYLGAEAYADFTIATAPAVNFTCKFPNVDTYLYRVGNMNTINLETLFEGTGTITSSKVNVTCTKISSGTQTNVFTFTPNNTNWGKGTIKFDANFTGVVTLTLTYDGTTMKTLHLEVIDAQNATSATSATSYNVVLLSDISIGSTTIKVSNGYSFYGNGFTVKTTSDGRYLNSGGLNTGFFVVTGGTMDNVQLDCAIYPRGYLYVNNNGTEYLKEQDNLVYKVTSGNSVKEYYAFQYSAVVVSEDGVISNCYIKGARNNILATGSATISNTTCDRGSLSNIYLTGLATSTVTLEDVTTIQYISPDDFGKGKNVEGVGVLVGDPNDTSLPNPNLVIKGELNQYNWVSSEDANSVSSSTLAQKIISSALKQGKYVHKKDDTDYVNLGILFLNTSTTNIDDQRSTGHGYEEGNVSITFGWITISGQVYAPANHTGTVEVKNSSYQYNASANNSYVPLYTVHGLDTTQPSGDKFCWNDNGKIRIQYPTGSEYAFDVAQYLSFGRYSDEEITYTVSCAKATSTSGTTVTFGSDTSVESEIVITVSGSKSYTPGGEETASQPYVIRIPVDVRVKKDIPNAVITVTSNSGSMIWGAAGTSSDPDYTPAAPIFENMTIIDYDDDGNAYTVLDGSNQINFLNSIQSVNNDSDNRTGFTIHFPDGTKLVIKCSAPYHSKGQLTCKKRNNSFYLCSTKSADNPTNVSQTIYSYTYTGRNGIDVKYDTNRTFSISSTNSTTYSLSSLSPNNNKFLKYDAQGGSVSPTYASSSPATLPTPTREGYTFQNWNTKADGTGTKKSAGTSYSFSSTTTLYAIWAESVEVSFNSEGTIVKDAAISAGAGTSQTLPTLTQTGYWLEGWYTAEAGEGEKIGAAGVSFTMPSVDTTYYAYWSPKYTVTYNANGGSVSTAEATYAGTPLTLPTPTNGAKTFEGWFTAAEGGTKIGAAGDGYIPIENIELFAQWSDNILVTFDGNGGTAGTNSDTYDNVTPITLPTATWAGHTFNGWYTAASGGTKIGNAGASYVPAEPTTLYAQWTAYTVSFDGNGATNPSSLSAGSDGSVTLPTPTRTGYTFNGWYTETSGGTKIGNGGASYTPTANITLHAQWEINSYKVTITTSNSSTAVSVGGTTVNNNGSVAYNTVVKVVLSYSKTDSPTFTIKQGSNNVTYYSNEACTTTSTSTAAGTYYFKMPAGDVTINSSSEEASSGGGGGFCVAAGTMITLADGTQKPVEAITMEDSVLAFNHETGELEPANIIFIEDDGVSQYNVINLGFSDGTVSRLINEHGYFDLDEMQYVYITEANCRDNIGHHFAKITEGETDYEVESVELVDAYVTEETTGCYSFPSAYHLNVIADGLLSMPGGIEGMFNIFAYDEDLKYDADAMARDIETYGLLTYDDFADVISYEEYAMYPASYLGVSLGKGLMTQEQLSYLIERYVAAKR